MAGVRFTSIGQGLPHVLSNPPRVDGLPRVREKSLCAQEHRQATSLRKKPTTRMKRGSKGRSRSSGRRSMFSAAEGSGGGRGEQSHRRREQDRSTGGGESGRAGRLVGRITIFVIGSRGRNVGRVGSRARADGPGDHERVALRVGHEVPRAHPHRPRPAGAVVDNVLGGDDDALVDIGRVPAVVGEHAELRVDGRVHCAFRGRAQDVGGRNRRG